MANLLKMGSALFVQERKRGNEDIPIPANKIGVAQCRIDRRLVIAERPSDDELLCDLLNALANRHGGSIVNVVLRRDALDGLRVVRSRVNDAPIPFICDLVGRKGDQIVLAVVFLCYIFSGCSESVGYCLATYAFKKGLE